jgi:hypothetical protein
MSYKTREARDRILQLTATEFQFEDTLQGRVLTYTRVQ